MVCAQTATNLIEPKMWPLLWMEWQEILHEVGHPHLARTIRGWPGSASGTERSHAIHGSTDGTPWPCQTRIPCHPWMVHAIRRWHGSASGTEHIPSLLPLASSCPPYTASWVLQAGVPQAGAGLVLDRSVAASSGTAGGDPAREAAPEASPGSPAPRPAPPNPPMCYPLALALALGPETGQLRTDGTECAVLGGEGL